MFEVVRRLKEALVLRGEGYGLRTRSVPIVCSFAGVPIHIYPGVFAPQPVSECLVALALDQLGVHRPRVVEVGTGSGAISLAIATKRPDAEIHATDISSRAIRCARENQRRLGLSSVTFYLGRLLDPLPHSLRGTVSLVVANLPFVPPAEAQSVSVFGPSFSLLGTDRDGLGLVREAARQSSGYLFPGAALVLQVAHSQVGTISSFIESLGYSLHVPEGNRDLRASTRDTQTSTCVGAWWRPESHAAENWSAVRERRLQ